jgi:hypothetical protein
MSGREFAVVLIEGACRHLLGDRLDITGGRWVLGATEAALKLRGQATSGAGFNKPDQEVT